MPKQLTEARLNWEQERSTLLTETKVERQQWQLEHERHLQGVRDNYKQDMADLESKAQDRHQNDTKVCCAIVSPHLFGMDECQGNFAAL